MLKKLLVIIVTLGVLASLFAGCVPIQTGDTGAGAAPETENTAAGAAGSEETQDEEVTLRMLFTNAVGGNEENFDAVIEDFMNKNPNIKVKPEVLPFSEYYTKLNIVNNSSNCPDVFEVNYENFQKYASYEGVIADLTELIAADEDFSSIPYTKAALEAFQYDGKRLGLGFNFSGVVMYYNKDLFDAKGVEYPDASWTWKEELEAAQKLVDPENGIIGSHAPIQFYEFYKTIAQNGGSVWSDDNASVTINSPECVEALQWMLDKGNKYQIDCASNDATWDQPDHDIKMFCQGKLAMARFGTWSLNRVATEAEFNWDIALEPGNVQKAHHIFIDGLVVSGKSKQVDAAYKLVKYMSYDPFIVEIKCEKGWGLPVVDDKAAMESFLNATPPESRHVIIDALNYATYPPVGPLPKIWSQYTAAVGDEIVNAKLEKKTAQQALDDAKAAIENIINNQ